MSAQTNNSVAPHIAAWLNNYNGNFEFYLSLKSQFNSKGTLSAKQVECVERAIAKEAAAKDEPKEVSNPTFAAGSILTLGKTTASRISQEVGLAFTYRNIEVLKTHKESARGIMVTFRYSSKVGTHCGVCNRPLTDEISVATGIGPDCCKRLGIERSDKSSAKEVVAKLEKALEAVGEIKEMWLPRLSVTLQGQTAMEDIAEESSDEAPAQEAEVIQLQLAPAPAQAETTKTYVYMVLCHHDESTDVEGVFSTAKKAEEFAKKFAIKVDADRTGVEIKIVPTEVK